MAREWDRSGDFGAPRRSATYAPEDPRRMDPGPREAARVNPAQALPNLHPAPALLNCRLRRRERTTRHRTPPLAAIRDVPAVAIQPRASVRSCPSRACLLALCSTP